MDSTDALSYPTNLADFKTSPDEQDVVTDAGNSAREPAKTLVDSTEIIRVTNITKRVTTSDGVLTIVNNANFTVLRGEAVAVVGASGSGKSTLLGIMAGLDTPTEGDVAINGESLFRLDEDGRAKLRGRLVGFVFQSFQLLPSLTALENVMLPLELAGAPDAQQKALAILERVGLKERVKHYPKQLSGGEQQRVAIARALLYSPKVLLADEPTGNLDSASSQKLWSLLRKIALEQSMLVLMVTHEPAAAAHCRQVFVLRDGRMLATIETEGLDASAVSARYQESVRQT